MLCRTSTPHRCSRFTSLVDGVSPGKYTRLLAVAGRPRIYGRRFAPDRISVLTALAVFGACRAGPRADEAAAPVRRFTIAALAFDAGGISLPVRVEVPEHTRSLAVMASGDPGALYALAELTTADGIEHVGLRRAIDLAAAMRDRYFDERSGEMPGGLHQMIRLGLFTHVYPDRPGLALPPGDVVLRIATSDRSRPVDVEVLLPEETGATTLPINLVFVPRAAGPAPRDAESARFLAPLRSILAGGGVEVAVERTVSLTDPGLAVMTELSEPQESPASASARLAVLGGAMTDGDALDLFIVEALPAGVGGWTLGTPGPPRPDTYYSGVVAARLDGGDELARVLAHELCHYLGLWHVEHVSRSGAVRPDRLDDTEPGTGNLMDEDRAGTRLTSDQRFVIGRHPLLR